MAPVGRVTTTERVVDVPCDNCKTEGKHVRIRDARNPNDLVTICGACLDALKTASYMGSAYGCTACKQAPVRALQNVKKALCDNCVHTVEAFP